MLKVVVPEDQKKLRKQTQALKYLIKNDTTDKDKLIHQEALKVLEGKFKMFDLKDTCNIKGYNKITLNRKMFESFLRNFMQSQGTKARETIEPISVRFVKDSSGAYLRFDYKIYGRKEWMHVTGKDTWY